MTRHLNVSIFVQKNAVAVAYAKQGKGVLRLNGELRGCHSSQVFAARA